ncbi:MAG: FAD-binding oxidoreductase, partial [Acidobacteriota bacterium]|nr:FAD-binding oxidoreductase [Acidobacteriota bacterium]
MQVKTQRDEFENYLVDASNLSGGRAEKLFVPETKEQIAEILKEANEKQIPVTVSGARTGTVGGAIPFGGWVISLEKFNKIKRIGEDSATVESGVILTDLQKAVEAENLFYPPDPTEWSCQIGGTIATNASGARSFKYGATRDYVQKLEVVTATGEIVNLTRGTTFAEDGHIEIETETGAKITAKLPTYAAPNVRKNAAGYFSSANTDAIDLFIGSEGTLGIITEAELKILPKPEGFFSGIVFFENETNLLDFVGEARAISFQTRADKIRNPKSEIQNEIDSSLLEYFDGQSLKFISEKFPEVPPNVQGAIYFEQETTAATEDDLLEKWNALLERHHADLETSWFTTTEPDREKMRAFRHALPVAVNERVVKNKQRKIGTDMAVPDENFASFLKFYRRRLDESRLDYVIFGHIGDNHLHA